MKEIKKYSYSNHYELIAPTALPLDVIKKYRPDLKRTIISADAHINPSDYGERKILHEEVVNLTGKYLHPHILGSVKGRSAVHCIFNVLLEKVVNNKTILSLDIKGAFLAADLFREASLLRKKLKRAGLPKDAIDSYINRIFRHFQVGNGSGAKFRGLAQGDILSSYLFSLLMEPVIKRFSRRYKIFNYVDDNYVILDREEDAEAAKAHFNECLERNGYSGRQFSLNTGKTELSAPNESTPVLGVILTHDLQIIPRPNRSLSAALNTIDQLARMLINHSDLNTRIGSSKLLCNMEDFCFNIGVAANYE